jgi:hypothetical protein
MSEQHAERENDWNACHRQARAMLDAAASATGEDERADFLRLAMEWLKLATELSKRADRDS